MKDVLPILVVGLIAYLVLSSKPSNIIDKGGIKYYKDSNGVLHKIVVAN